MTTAPVNNQSQLLPTSTVLPEDPKELLISLTTQYTRVATNINQKPSGIFETSENLNGEAWFNPGNTQVRRQTFRKAFNLGAIAAGATLTTPHGITSITSFTAIGGTCVTAVPDYRPIPFASATAVTNQIEIEVNATNLVIINGATAPNIVSAIVVLEYLKQ